MKFSAILFFGTILVSCNVRQLALGQTFDTEFKHTDSTGKDVLIQNSFPKAGGDADEKSGYTDSSGKNYRYVIFWTRVTNETATPLELTISFPAILPSPYSNSKLFLPRDTMTLDKVPLYNYGVTGLKSFLDTDFNSTLLKRTINPQEECLFYVALLSVRYSAGGAVRAGLVLEGQNVFYKINIGSQSALIPCGQLVSKK